MPLRMLEYSARVFRLFGSFPRQILLYVGEADLRMESVIAGPSLSFRYQIADIRDFDGEELLDSSQTGDNVIAVLARLRDHREAVRRILARIAGLERADRELAFRQLTTLAGLRQLEEFIEKEARKMPLLDDIMDNKVLGRERKLGMAIGREEGFHEGQLKTLVRLMEKRFGPIPDWAAKALQEKPSAELEELSVRLLDAGSLTDLLK